MTFKQQIKQIENSHYQTTKKIFDRMTRKDKDGNPVCVIGSEMYMIYKGALFRNDERLHAGIRKLFEGLKLKSEPKLD